MNPVSQLALPPTSLTLPENCILISFDCEANCSPADSSVVPGSAISLGAAAFMWPEGTLVPLTLRDATFHTQLEPSVPQDKRNKAFWAKHQAAARHALPWRPAKHELLPVEEIQRFNARVINEFYMWCLQNRPLAFLSRPHAYDGAHLWHLLAQFDFHLEDPIANATWHDVKDVLLAQPGGAERYAQFKQATQNLPHIADQDALLQGFAFIRAMRTLPRDVSRFAKFSSTAD